MKKIILAINFFLYLSSLAQENNIRVRYIKGLKKVADTTNSKPSMLKDLYYTLITNGKESVFYYKEGMKISGQETNKRFIGAGGGDGIYYKNITNKKYLHQSDFLGNEYLVSLNEKVWVLTKEKKVVNNFLCYKAFSEQIYYSEIFRKEVLIKHVAWYTPEIPVPFGPTVFNGLPGLVIAAQVGGYYYYADKIEFNLKENPIIIPKKGTVISELELMKKIKEFEKKQFQKFEKN